MKRAVTTGLSLSLWFVAAIVTTASEPSQDLELYDVATAAFVFAADSHTATKTVHVSISEAARDVEGGFVGELGCTLLLDDEDGPVSAGELVTGATVTIARGGSEDEPFVTDGTASTEILADGVNEETLTLTLTLVDDIVVADLLEIPVEIEASARFPEQIVGSPVPGRDPELPADLKIEITVDDDEVEGNQP